MTTYENDTPPIGIAYLGEHVDTIPAGWRETTDGLLHER